MKFLAALAQARHLAEVNIAAEHALEAAYRFRRNIVALVVILILLVGSAVYAQAQAISELREDVRELEAQ